MNALDTARVEALRLAERLCLMHDQGMPPKCHVLCHQKVLLVNPSCLSPRRKCKWLCSDKL